jgi:hypothetical protein
VRIEWNIVIAVDELVNAQALLADGVQKAAVSPARISPMVV